MTIPSDKELREAVEHINKTKSWNAFSAMEIKPIIDLAQAYLSGELFMSEEEVLEKINAYEDELSDGYEYYSKDGAERLAKALVGKIRS